MERDKKLLVTGGAGFIGSNFIRYWLENHPRDQVVNLDALTYAGNLESLKDLPAQYSERYSFELGNIGNQELVEGVLIKHKPDVVVNFAAESHNSRSVDNPGLFFETNVLGTQRLLEASRRHGIGRFHHISTCEVYGDLELDSDEKFREDSPYRPRTPYNASKAGADMAARAYYETYGLPVTISNCSNNYGPYQFPEKLIPHFVTRGLRGENLPLYQQSRNKREWLHVLDHCRAIDLILERGRVGESYNVGSGIEADIETVADLVVRRLGLDPSSKTYVPDRPGHDKRYLLDCTKIRAELGWAPQIDFVEGLRETIDWYVQNRNWWEPLISKSQVNEELWRS